MCCILNYMFLREFFAFLNMKRKTEREEEERKKEKNRKDEEVENQK